MLEVDRAGSASMVADGWKTSVSRCCLNLIWYKLKFNCLYWAN